jgi:hypothetical protein
MMSGEGRGLSQPKLANLEPVAVLTRLRGEGFGVFGQGVRMTEKP